MRIAWFTPFSNDSAIGLYSKIACEALSKYHEIQIFSPGNEFRNTFIPVFSIDSVKSYDLKKFDILIYNIGNYYPYHAQILDISKENPGIYILHDLAMLDFMVGYYVHYKNDVSLLYDTLKNLYSTEETDMLLHAANNAQKWNNIDFIKYNAIDWVIENARGIIVHSNYHLSHIKKYYSGLSEVIYFPYSQEQTIEKHEEHKKTNNKIELLTVGCVNPNKRVAQVIEAIGCNREICEHVHYTVAGGLGNQEYSNNLRELIKKYNLENVVHLNGFTPDEQLDEYYKQADILINLRNPAVEGASWSLVEQMWRGKPVMVTDTGFYAEMPDDCVYKISDNPVKEVETIQNVLLTLMKDSTNLRDTGLRAQAYSHKQFSIEQYVQAMESYLLRYQKIAPIEELVDDVIHEFNIMKLYGYNDFYKQYADDIEYLFTKHD